MNEPVERNATPDGGAAPPREPPDPEASTLPFTGERFDPAAASGEMAHEHLHRYLFATQFCAEKDVLDVAAGEGYGASLLAACARSVIGVDRSAEAVEHARRRYGRERLEFRRGDCTAIPLGDRSVDVVVSFETVEHVEDQEGFLREVARVLRPDGLLVMSTPDREVYSAPGTPPNPYHVKELTTAELSALLGTRFSNVECGIQKATSGSILLARTPGPDHLEFFARATGGRFERREALPDPPYRLAVASNAPLPSIHWSVLDDPAYAPELRARIARAEAEAAGLREALRRREGAAAEVEAALAEAQAMAREA